MGLKQEEVIKRLPEHNYNIAKTMRSVGYSSATCRSGSQYAALRQKMLAAYDPEVIKAKVIKAERKFIKDNDNSNYARMVELQTKIVGLGKDSTATQVNVNINDTINKLRAKTIDTTHCSA